MCGMGRAGHARSMSKLRNLIHLQPRRRVFVCVCVLCQAPVWNYVKSSKPSTHTVEFCVRACVFRSVGKLLDGQMRHSGRIRRVLNENVFPCGVCVCRESCVRQQNCMLCMVAHLMYTCILNTRQDCGVVMCAHIIVVYMQFESI